MNKDSVSKFGEQTGLQSETKTCNVYMKCSCDADNYVSSEEMDNQSWSCWSCSSQIASIIGKRYSHKDKQGNEIPSYCRVYNLANVVVEKSAAGENDD